MLLADQPRRRNDCSRWRQFTPLGWPGLLVLSLLLATLQQNPPAFAGSEQASAQSADRDGKDDTRDTRQQTEKSDATKRENRAKSVRALLAHLNLCQGATVADIGAGKGQDTWVFAEVVGETGTVYAEEIEEGLVKSLKEEAEKKGLSQVRAVLGREDDPGLPENAADLAFLRYVYHHLAKPRKMLQGIWRSLKPGGYLVVVDRHRGTLRDWVPREQRKDKHSWLAETTVVREAREEGFVFGGCAEENWHDDKPFVLVFQRPEETQAPGRDPDPFSPLSATQASRAFLPLGSPYRRPVFIALGEGRKLIEPILQGSSGQALEIVLEEWATQKDERPPLPGDVSFPSALTEKGDPHLGPEPIDVVFFLDSYHLLFHGKTLLAKIHEKLEPTGYIYVLDRKAQRPLSRREASHCRRIEPEVVNQEMAAAGFFLWFEGPQLSADRFLLVFGKAKPEELAMDADPFVTGPEITQPPGQWLKENGWRLRGLKTADGKFVPFTRRREQVSIEVVNAGSPDIQTCKVPSEGLLLTFRKDDGQYLLTDSQPLDGRN